MAISLFLMGIGGGWIVVGLAFGQRANEVSCVQKTGVGAGIKPSIPSFAADIRSQMDHPQGSQTTKFDMGCSIG